MNPEHPAAPPDAVDPAAVKRAFGRAAGTYDAAAVLQREVGARMAERLDLVKLSPGAILDAGCGTGEALAALATRYPASRRIALDLAWPMVVAARERHGQRRSALARVTAAWRRSSTPPPLFVTGDIAALPFAAGTFGLVWSNLALQWLGDLPRALSEMHRVLRVEGLAMFTTLGPDTLRELRAAFRDADSGPHVNRF
ncbi:MAG: methyltransferase domain-containing protein, partial [Betaproteobacteria bacterium]